MQFEDVIIPQWPTPPNIRSLVTTRLGGISETPYDRLNLGNHVGDDEYAVHHNRKLLAELLGEEIEFQWLCQVHGDRVIVLDNGLVDEGTEADAIYSTEKNIACGVLTADCLSVLFCDSEGREFAVAHAGWKGMAAGVLLQTLANFDAEPSDIMVWLGPVIGPCHFEVSDEVRHAFLSMSVDEIHNEKDILFQPSENNGKWMCDLYAIAKIILGAAGVKQIYGDPICTYCEFDSYYSYRRDGKTGRFATLIWRTSSHS